MTYIISFFTCIYLLFRQTASYLLENIVNNSLVKKGKKSYIEPSTSIRHPKNILIGTNSYVNKNCILWPGIKSKITIGNNVLFGPNVKIFGANHGIAKSSLINKQRWIEDDVFIGNDVWIGANTTIIKGSIIPDGSVIGANSLVNEKISKKYSIYAGIPIKFIKHRK